MPDMRLALRIVDIGAGGCALVLPDDVPALQPGSRLAGVRIDLDGDTGFDATLRLQHVSALHGDGSGVRLGCEFVDLDGQAQRALHEAPHRLDRADDADRACQRVELPRQGRPPRLVP